MPQGLNGGFAKKLLRMLFLYIDGWKRRMNLQIFANSVLHVFQASKRDRYRKKVVKSTATSATHRNQVNILNIPVDNLSMLELLENLNQGVVFTPNVDHLIKLQHDPDFLKIYLNADFRVCDSQILLYASRFLGTPLKEKVSGSDLFPAFYQFHAHNPDISMFLLGAAPGIADRAKAKINHKVGREIVVGSLSPSYGFEKSEQECLAIIDAINSSKATVLAVGAGAPKQEKWIAKYKDKFSNIKIFLAVGATIDFEAGSIKRSPKWMSKMGIEWVFRIYSDPKRLWKRYLVEDLPFFWLLVKQKLGSYKPPAL
jgi:N-acetylglucosaminyldiphosphoundecaprenol N-acetyl-beta-D-mannosaminyltransferase